MATQSVANPIPQNQSSPQRILDVTAGQWEQAELPHQIERRMVEMHKVALALTGIARVLRDDELGPLAIAVTSDEDEEPVHVPLNPCTRGELHIAMQLLLNKANAVLEELPDVLKKELQHMGRA